MRLGLRGLVVSLLSLFLAMACLGGENQCLNPQPECPGSPARPGTANGGTFGAAAGSGSVEGPPHGGSSATGAGGAGIHVDLDGGPSENDAGASGEFAGAGGDTAVIPGAEGGAAGSGGAGGSEETR